MRERLEDAMRYAAAYLFGIVVLALVAGVPVLLLVTSTHGLGETVRHRAEVLMGGKNYEVHLGRVLFSPVRGFVLERLQVLDRPSGRLVVSTDQLMVSLNMDSLLRGAPQLERIRLSDATLDIPLGAGEQPRLKFTRVRGEIICPPGEFRLTTSSFEVAGITVEVIGTFLNPKSFSARPVPSSGPGKVAGTIEGIRKELASIRWGGTPPSLVIEAGGDLGNPDSIRVDRARFVAGEGNWHGVAFRRIDLLGAYGAGKLRLDKFIYEDGTGILRAVGSADFPGKKGTLEFGGSLDASPLPSAILGEVKGREWEWKDPVRLNGDITLGWSGGSPVPSGTVELEAGRFGYRGVFLDSFSAGASFREGKILLRDLHASGDPGKVDADLLVAPGDNRLRVTAAIYPGRLAPLASGRSQEALAAMDFKDPLRISFEGAMPGKDPLTVAGSGTLEAGRAAMRGAAIEGLSSRFTVANGAVDFRDILVRMGEGVGRGEFIYDYRNWEGRFPGVRTTLDPVKLMTWIDPKIAEGIVPYRFVKPPDVQLSGKVGLRNPDKNDLRMVVNAPAGLGYTLIGKDLPFGSTSGTVLLKGQKLLLDLPKSRLFGGDVALKADVSVAPGDTRFGASVHLQGVDFKQLTKVYFGYDESSGDLTGDYSFRSVGGNDLSMTGKGSLLITGNVLAMPVLGPLSLLLSEVIPGFGYQSARQATADFSVENGIITTKDLLIQGKGFDMIGNGTIHYLEDRMNMNIRLNAQGLPGLVLFPVSKALEYESLGSAKHPKWRPKLLPKIGGSAQPEASPAQPEPSPTP
jgi:hypothetical protein